MGNPCYWAMLRLAGSCRPDYVLSRTILSAPVSGLVSPHTPLSVFRVIVWMIICSCDEINLVSATGA